MDPNITKLQVVQNDMIRVRKCKGDNTNMKNLCCLHDILDIVFVLRCLKAITDISRIDSYRLLKFLSVSANI